MEEQTIPDWETNPDKYLRDKEGGFVLKKDGTPRKKARQYNYHSEVKARMKAKAELSRVKRDVKKLQSKLNSKKATLENKTETVNKILGEAPNKDSVITEADLDLLPPMVKKDLMDQEVEIAFRPNAGPQTDFLAADETDVLYGGAAGGGKSFAMLVDPLRYVHEADHYALILRKSLGELDELITKSRDLYPKAFVGAKYKESKKAWEFPSGAVIKFGYLERDADVYQYQGRAYTWIGFDELTHLPTSFAWDYLRSRLRTTNPRIKCYMRSTANPGGAGHQWVKERYVMPAPANTTFYETNVDSQGNVHKLSRKFIPAKLVDNPYLSLGGQYESMLMSLDPITRKRLLEGDWDVNEGAAFPEFDSTLGAHVIPPMAIPAGWDRFKAIDYGYRAPSCCLWFAVDPSDGTLIVYRELYQKGLTGTTLGNAMHDMEREELRSVVGVLDGSTWDQRGSTGPSIGEEIVRTGHKLRRADKNRIAGKIQVHERLRINPITGRPKVQIFSNCTNIISQMKSIPLDDNNKEDVDTTSEDHAYDAFRYGVMSRPRMDDPYMRMLNFKNRSYQPVDADFGY